MVNSCLLFIFPIIFAQCTCINLHRHWEVYKKEYGKNYTKAEDSTRYAIFVDKFLQIKEHNREFKYGKTTYKIGLNQFSDMSWKELYMNTPCLNSYSFKASQAPTHPNFNYTNLPKEIDWRKSGYVTPIRNQGGCGSCYAFASIGAVEGLHKKMNGTLIPLSEQNTSFRTFVALCIVDCSESFGNMGCLGGYMDLAFGYIKKFGIESEMDYPYYGSDELPCKYDPSKVVFNISGFVTLPMNDELALQAAVATQGPVTVGLLATSKMFDYASGVFYDPTCNSPEHHHGNHGALVVGYGTDANGLDYWLIKNSWGMDWGESGYLRLARSKQSHCYVANVASYPFVF